VWTTFYKSVVYIPYFRRKTSNASDYNPSKVAPKLTIFIHPVIALVKNPFKNIKDHGDGTRIPS